MDPVVIYSNLVHMVFKKVEDYTIHGFCVLILEWEVSRRLTITTYLDLITNEEQSEKINKH